jgi:hypothetical protein
MTPFVRFCTAALQASALIAIAPSSQAAPGAHGPDGQHLDATAPPASGNAGAPRFEAWTETFEMVGRLQDGKLTLFINRFETNEPVLEATVELETADVKVTAPFRAELGDYAVDDKAFIETLSRPGRHSLVVLVVAGADSDLMDATLTVPPTSDAGTHDHGHAWWERPGVTYAALGLTTVLVAVWLLARRRRPAMPLPEATR